MKTKEDSSLCVQNATSSGKENHVDRNPTDSIVDLKCNANLWQQKFWTSWKMGLISVVSLLMFESNLKDTFMNYVKAWIGLFWL